MKRFNGIDIIKTFAAFFVISVHFFLNTNYYNTELILSKNLFFQTSLRWVFLICVPLFLISTGYLQSNKKPNKTYYKGLINILVIYLIYSILAIVIRSHFFNENQSPIKWAHDIIKFYANPYSWYINMFFGLYLLVPFLNILFKHLDSKRDGKLLILSLIILCGLPSFFNYMPLTWNGNSIFYFPDWWMILYPIAYYFIGCYIREYSPRINKLLGILLFSIVIIIEVTLTFYFSRGGNFVNAIGEYGSLSVILSSTLFFLIFYDINIKSKGISAALRIISGITLDIYLCSYCVDRFVYHYIMTRIYESNYQIIFYFVPVVCTVFLISVSVGLIRSYLMSSIIKAAHNISKAQ
jgi:surface polysaccharide O-acyltransferase-like enzyme